MKNNLNPLMTSINQNWKTPDKLYQELNKEFNFNLDPCPSNPDFDGLNIDWKGNIYINPPYKDSEKWIVKGLKEMVKHNAKTLVYLLPSRTDTKLFHNFILPLADEIRFLKGRLIFPPATNSAPFPSMIVIYTIDE